MDGVKRKKALIVDLYDMTIVRSYCCIERNLGKSREKTRVRIKEVLHS